MKKLRYVFILLFSLFFLSIVLSASIRHIYTSDDSGERRLGFLSKPLKFMAETPSIIKKILKKPEFYKANSESKDGLVHLIPSGKFYYPKLLVPYKKRPFDLQFELIDINNGQIIKNWAPDNKDLFAKAYNENNPRKPQKGSDLYFMHPYMDQDSALIFNSQLSSLLVKIDSQSNIVWFNNDRTYHHATEADEEDQLYTCTTPFVSGHYDFLPGSFETYKRTLLDDHITRINPDNGSITFDKSVIEILLENGYEGLLLSKGQIISDPTHLNDIQPALSSSDYWEKGDLLISCRNISTVFLYRPSTNKILWLQHGPWLNQHDVDFHGKNEIVVFGNDIIREESRLNKPLTNSNLIFSEKRPHNEVYFYNFQKDSIYTPYTKMLKMEEVKTITSGRCDILENGDLFFEETNQGRIIIGDSIHKKIEYVKRIDDKHVASLFWSRIIK